MTSSSDDQGVIQVLLDRFNEQRLPRLLDLKKKVDEGQTLADQDLDFLQQVGEDAGRIRPILERNPQYQALAARALQLFADISNRAMQNEVAQGGGQP